MGMKPSLFHGLCHAALMLAACAIYAPAPSAAEQPTLSLGLMGWWGPPPTEVHVNAYRGAGFNLLPIPGDPEYQEGLDRAWRAGLSVVFEQPDGADAPGPWSGMADEHPHAAGWALRGAASHANTDELVSMVRAIRARHPQLFTLVPIVNPSTSPESRETLSDLIQAGMNALLLQSFYMTEDEGDNEERFYEDLLLAKRVAELSGAPLWGMVQVTEHGPYRRASESDVRVQAYTYLAAGAKGLAFYTYWGPTQKERGASDVWADWGEAMIDPDAMRYRYGYEVVRGLTPELKALQEHLMPLQAKGVYLVNDAPPGAPTLTRGAGPIAAVQAERALVSFFEAPGGTPWAMVVNRRHGALRSAAGRTSTVRVQAAAHIERVDMVDPETGDLREVELDGANAFFETIPGGTGRLFRFTPSEENDSENADP